MSELKQIMPADGWYARLKNDKGEIHWDRLMSFGLFSDDGEPFIAGIIPGRDDPIDEHPGFKGYIHFNEDGTQDTVLHPPPLTKSPDIKIMGK